MTTTTANDQAHWDALSRELDAWHATGRAATLWWRDDDAVAPTPDLERMLALASEHGVPLGLAVIPLPATAALVERLRSAPLVEVLQHGFRHANHARTGERASEIGDGRPLADVMQDIADGWRQLARFGSVTAMLVPPWNRYTPAILPHLAPLGLAAVSAYGPRPARRMAGGIIALNCHADIISWRSNRAFTGTGKALAMLTGHLERRRSGAVDVTEPTGLLTHHLAHDAGCWDFLATLFERTARHQTVRWLTPGAAMSET